MCCESRAAFPSISATLQWVQPGFLRIGAWKFVALPLAKRGATPRLRREEDGAPVVHTLDLDGRIYEIVERVRCYKPAEDGSTMMVMPPTRLAQNMDQRRRSPLPQLRRTDTTERMDPHDETVMGAGAILGERLVPPGGSVLRLTAHNAVSSAGRFLPLFAGAPWTVGGLARVGTTRAP
jgi:hypothetical protein